ncbi:Fe-S cluster assembly protein SufB [Clostridium sp.]|uniref:Fe-S cluster assembly protein SufB n=1 Tax=Clostridium sp. TaxID=1506 RepID=UPI0035A08BC7
MKKNKTYIKDIIRSIYDIKNKDKSVYKTERGLTRKIIEEISCEKNDPAWMREFRLKSLEIYDNMPMPSWGPDLTDLNMDNIVAYVRPDMDMKHNWRDVPKDIKNTFDLLGIPKAEQKSLAGVGAQYDSEVVYHNVSEELKKQGVLYMDMETAIRDYEELVRPHFMKLVPPTDHKFAALHGAVWSGGSFVYVPQGVQVDIPIQSYFRLNAPGAGQFEHTLIIVEKGAKIHYIEGCSAPKYYVNNLHAGCVEVYIREGASLKYSTIENWSRNMYNLNTKRAVVDKDGHIEWVTGSFGSKVSMLYPMSILKGEGAKCDFTGITFAGANQYLDTGSKVIHAAPNTTSTVNSKSISKDGGVSIYRGLLSSTKNAVNSKSSVSCESLMLDSKSRSDTIPVINVCNNNVDIGHEAKIGRISEEAIFYLMSRGLTEEEAKGMVVTGFVEPIAKELPLEYAVEMNNLIKIELKGTIG